MSRYDRVLRAMSPSPWEFSNSVLYDLCRKHPAHIDTGEVLAKIMLIGRSHAAAIERRRTKTRKQKNDRFYLSTVAPKIMQSHIDVWLDRARDAIPGTSEAFRTMIEVHGQTTALFAKISDLEKRSLASKYLHFHVPKLFYIFDSRAVESMREYAFALPRASRAEGLGDNEYRKFAEKCDHLRRFCVQGFGLHVLPRHVDNLLLKVNEK